MKIKNTQLIFIIILEMLIFSWKLSAISYIEDIFINGLYYDRVEKNDEILFKTPIIIKENQYFSYDTVLHFNNKIFSSPLEIPLKRVLKISKNESDFYEIYEYASFDNPINQRGLKRLVYNEITIFTTDKKTGDTVINSFEYEIIAQSEDNNTCYIKGIKEKSVSTYEKIQNYILSNNIDYAFIEKNNGHIFLKFNNINFAPESSKIDCNSSIMLNKYLEILDLIKDKKLVILGYCADVGSEKSIEILSQKRASEVNLFLKNHGLKAKTIVSGKGKIDPIGDNNTKDGRAKNRRTTLMIRLD